MRKQSRYSIRSKVFLSGFFFALLASIVSSKAQATPASFESQFLKSKLYMLQNMTRPDAAPGAIIAAPSSHSPDYYYHWVRDAALTVNASLDLYEKNQLTDEERQTLQRFYVSHLQFNQQLQNNSLAGEGLGEPKFTINGLVYAYPWGRPQNDSPALRAQSLIRYFQLAKRENGPLLSTITPVIYQSQWPNNSLVKSDLEYTAHHWRDLNFDLWEEVYGFHFYTLMAQRKALISGAQLAQEFQDFGAANFYLAQAQEISSTLEHFWSAQENSIAVTLQSTNESKSHLDVAVLLAVLHASCDTCTFSATDDRVLATFQKLKEVFSQSYVINSNSDFGTAFGRYPDDTYDGYKTNSAGNPWVLTTAAAAEYLYRTSIEFSQKKAIQINSINIQFFQSLTRSNKLSLNQVIPKNSALFIQILSRLNAEADTYLERIIFHKNSDGSLSEQMNRNTGYMQGAPNLTWSHASFLTAKMARDQAQHMLHIMKGQL